MTALRSTMKLRYSQLKLLTAAFILAAICVVIDIISLGTVDKAEIIIASCMGLVSLGMTWAAWCIGITTSFKEDGISQWLFFSERFIAWDELIPKTISPLRVVLHSRNSKTMVVFLGSFFWKDKKAVQALLKEKGLI